MGDWDHYREKGRVVEIEFGELMGKFGKVTPSTPEQDMREHIDMFLTSNKTKQTTSFDVKAVKEIKRGTGKDDTAHHIELLNVNGHDGWLYGKATFISFETFKTFVVVDRLKLINLIDRYLDKPIYCFDEPLPYCIYKRKDYINKHGEVKRRKDETMLVETSKLIEIATLIINKN
jgi:hypothetical protein